jgi:flagellar motor protein MotB
MKAAFIAPDSGNAHIVPIQSQTGGALGNRQGLRNGDQTGSGTAAWEMSLLRDHIESILQSHAISGKEDDDPIRVKATPRGLILSLSGEKFFSSGKTSLTRSALPLLDKIAKSIATSGAQIRVEGHSATGTKTPSSFASNWEFTSARAGAITRHLIKKHRIAAARIGIAGFSDLRPVAPNDSKAGRNQNNRIELVILHPTSSPEDASSQTHDSALQGLLDRLAPLEEK